ncbi:hypothetical protein [Flavobacterium sp. UBA6135]|uniref:hypothetical protein n=1 Tax=Flavobacterium sp. UBA6135 TaxID=1946553 RepID=UPI0025BB091C|nr:hypothetical protein [Flavobacterium sp. UBA6135]
MRYFLYFLLLFSFSVKGQVITGQHCGYDFTSYLVVKVNEVGKSETIKNLRISIADSLGREVINVNNLLSWTKRNEPLVFSMNYKIDKNGAKVAADTPESRWFFPFAKEHYLLSVTNTFNAENYFLKIEDIDGDENGGSFQTQLIQLYPFNMYVLCSSENERQAQQFGPKTNRPIEVYLVKK